MKQSTIGEILDSEKQMVLNAPKKYGAYYANAFDSSLFLSKGIKSISRNRSIFVRFLSQVKKHHMLGLFSVVRLHKVQAMLNLRYCLEAGANAAYAISNLDPAGFVDIDERGLLDPSQELTKKRYTWLETTYSKGSTFIKGMKNQINRFTAHSNFIATDQNFRLGPSQNDFETPIFDFEDDYFIRIDLWMVGNITIGLMDLFYGVSREAGGVVFTSDFEKMLLKLASDNNSIKEELMADERYKRAQQSENSSAEKL